MFRPVVSIFFSLAAVVLTCPRSSANEPQLELFDDRLSITLFASDPDIRTPIGIAIDSSDRIFVIESHTHHPPRDYDGPDCDRIKIFEDANGDGQVDRISRFAEGIHQAMNLAFSPNGELYVACAREVLRLVDEDEDGICDRKERVLKLVTPQRYAHNCLLGITFDRDGWMYVSRGNVASDHYRFEGNDDTTVEGYGDGGNVIRCRPDGTRIEEFATGFWNSMDLKFDRNGRLLLVDNDPDARGPNRLVHVVRGGDYGHKSMYGGGGNHPFQGWDGTLPGTLPYIAGTGEAPCAVLDCRRSSLPIDYKKSVLVTVWNENSIERFELAQQGATLAVEKKSLFLSGPHDFRPVALDCDSRGNLYITDWVLVNYPNHGRGRIWRVSGRDKANRLIPEQYHAPYHADQTGELTSQVARSDDRQVIVKALASDDPFVRHAAVQRIADSRFRQLRDTLADHVDPRIRLGVLLAHAEVSSASPGILREFLTDPDQNVRRAALMWAGESMQIELRSLLELALGVEPLGAVLFETYLAAVQNLDEEFVRAYRSREDPKAKNLKRPLRPSVLIRVAKNEKYPQIVRSLAIGRFEDNTAEQNFDWLLEKMRSSNDRMAIAAMDRLSSLSDASLQTRLSPVLVDICLSAHDSSARRCEALLALSELAIKVKRPRRLLPLLNDKDGAVAVEAARMFRAWLDSGVARQCIDQIVAMNLTGDVKEPLSYALQGKLFDIDLSAKRPKSNEDWKKALIAGGNAGRGRRVFFTERVGCTKCHTVDGRGGILGPDLSRVAQSKSREQIIDSILDPSAEFPPQYQAWVVITTDGRIHRGLQLDHKSGGAIVLTTEDGDNRYFKANEIEQYYASPTSLMPEGLSDTMSVHEFRDLVAFLESLKS